MTNATEASKQIGRFSGLDFYPHNDKAALLELRVAGESAYSEAVLRQVVDGWLEQQARCPKPAELRRMILDKHTAFVRAKCKFCDNSGFITVWKLVTYKPGTYQIKYTETLDLDIEQLDEFRKKLNKDQDILSAAKPCVCLDVTHKLFTGERD